MKLNSFLTFLLMPAAVVLAQTTPPAPPPAAPAPEVAPTAVVMTIGTEKITREQFEAIIRGLPERVQSQLKSGAEKRRLADQLADMLALAQEAKKRGLDQTAEMKQRLAMQSQQVLAQSAYEKISGEVKPDDAALKAYYDQHKSEYEEVKARHILVPFKGSGVPLKPGSKEMTEEEALAKTQEIRKKIQGGADFAAVAKEESSDTGSAAQGGLLPPFSHGQMVPQFEEAAFALPIGQLSEPVKSPFGYHLIQVQEHKSKSFDEVKDNIGKQLQPDLARKAVENIRKSANVTLNDGYFGPASQPVPVVMQPAPPAAK